MAGKKAQNYQFVAFIVGLILFIYFVTFKMVVIDHYSDRSWFLPYVLFFNLIFILLIWSLVKTMITDPGRVPAFWGFYIEKSEFKKRRYCLICHIFKPERCHHCSACNRCVLNMDHHCPWINNCVGFENRKFFILMLTYIVLTDFLALFPLISYVANIIEDIDSFFEGENVDVEWFSDLIIFVACILSIIAFFVIGNFYKFHIQLVLVNSSTIENLDQKRKSNGQQNKSQTNYDMGPYYNFLQVFGNSYYLWPLPLFLESGKPVGDGIVWPQRYTQDEEDDVKLKSPVNQSQVNHVNNGYNDSQQLQQYNSQFKNDGIQQQNINLSNNSNAYNTQQGYNTNNGVQQQYNSNFQFNNDSKNQAPVYNNGTIWICMHQSFLSIGPALSALDQHQTRITPALPALYPH